MKVVIAPFKPLRVKVEVLPLIVGRLEHSLNYSLLHVAIQDLVKNIAHLGASHFPQLRQLSIALLLSSPLQTLKKGVVEVL